VELDLFGFLIAAPQNVNHMLETDVRENTFFGFVINPSVSQIFRNFSLVMLRSNE